MSYKIVWSQKAQINLEKLDLKTKSRIITKVEGIKENPLDYVKHLAGVPLFSLRVGDYRVILDINNNQMLIFIVKLGHRRNIYDEI